MARGDLQTAGRKRKAPDNARVAARIAKFRGEPKLPEGVQPLNPGFFMLERLRAHTVLNKARGRKQRAKVKGK